WCYSFFFFSSRRRHTRFSRDWSSDVCSSDLNHHPPATVAGPGGTARRAAPAPGKTPSASARTTTSPGETDSLRRTPRRSREPAEIGRASCRERVEIAVVAGGVQSKRRSKL